MCFVRSLLPCVAGAEGVVCGTAGGQRCCARCTREAIARVSARREGVRCLPADCLHRARREGVRCLPADCLHRARREGTASTLGATALCVPRKSPTSRDDAEKRRRGRGTAEQGSEERGLKREIVEFIKLADRASRTHTHAAHHAHVRHAATGGAPSSCARRGRSTSRACRRQST